MKNHTPAYWLGFIVTLMLLILLAAGAVTGAVMALAHMSGAC